MTLSKSEQYHVGLAALYCYESMQPEISETKKDGLQKFYNIKDEETLKFFTVHMHADKWHSEVVRNIIRKVADTRSKQEEIKDSVDSALLALNNFLSGMQIVLKVSRKKPYKKGSNYCPFFNSSLRSKPLLRFPFL